MGWAGAFEEQGFELSGLLLGATEVKAGMYFDPTAIKYKHTFVEVKPPLAGLNLGVKAEHWAEGISPKAAARMKSRSCSIPGVGRSPPCTWPGTSTAGVPPPPP